MFRVKFKMFDVEIDLKVEDSVSRGSDPTAIRKVWGRVGPHEVNLSECWGIVMGKYGEASVNVDLHNRDEQVEQDSTEYSARELFRMIDRMESFMREVPTDECTMPHPSA
jgi:hypothetical protein